jgi:hypothetical protein
MRWPSVLVVFLVCPLTAQSVTYYGPGTGMTVTGAPRLANPIELSTGFLGGWQDSLGHGNASGTLLLGVDQISVQFRRGYTSGGTGPAPLATLLTSPLVMLPMPIVSSNGSRWTYQNVYRITIPNDPVLIGGSFAAQWLYHRSQTIWNLIWVGYNYHDTSNAAWITIGA